MPKNESHMIVRNVDYAWLHRVAELLDLRARNGQLSARQVIARIADRFSPTEMAVQIGKVEEGD